MCAQFYKKLLSKVAVRVAFPPAKYVGRLAPRLLQHLIWSVFLGGGGPF